jgi:hypothetical protein
MNERTPIKIAKEKRAKQNGTESFSEPFSAKTVSSFTFSIHLKEFTFVRN